MGLGAATSVSPPPKLTASLGPPGPWHLPRESDLIAQAASGQWQEAQMEARGGDRQEKVLG